MASTVPSEGIAATRADSYPTTHFAPIAKKKSSTARVKRGRKTLLSLPLRPWPPREDSTPRSSDATAITNIAEHGEQTKKPGYESGHLAVKVEPGEASKPMAGHCDGKEHTPVTEADRPDNAMTDTCTMDGRCAEKINNRDQGLSLQQQAPSDALEGQSAHDSGPSSKPALNPSHPVDALRGASDRAGPIKVTKASRKTQAIHDVQPRAFAGFTSSQRYTRMTTLDDALESVRKACLADQARVENRMTAAINKEEEERLQLQDKIDRQLADIAELRLQLQTAEDDLSRRKEKVISLQKYVSGYQKDHDNSRKLIVAFQEQIKQLQDQITKIVEERDALKGDLETLLESMARSQRTMLGTMRELYARHVLALSREEDLKGQLEQQDSMRNEEKSRRIELENRLLESVQSMQRQLNESSATLDNKFENLRTDLENHAAETSNDCSIKDCLLILQRLESLPLLTANDARRAEGMLRFLHEQYVPDALQIIKH